MSIGVVSAVIIIVIAILIWRNSMKAREHAVYMAVKTAKQWDVQLLDDTVCLTKMRLSRQSNIGSMCLFREYAFEYSYDGVDRYKAFLQFNGNQFLQVISNDQKISFKEIQGENATHNKEMYTNNIIDLSAYRTEDKKSPNKDNDKE
ncbi:MULTISPECIES: DUF3301 domain-containing protein [Cysteiniphilum]|uniref:DUF3301 domain-containing protein n=1 Tax=Cysteiniphilum TaxID=2056696 RepID=UPI00177E7A2D|nr:MULTISPECIES: DUF3301 domain-containing protein [Cysteiniphilum]